MEWHGMERHADTMAWFKGHGGWKRNEVGERILSGAAVPRHGSSAFDRMASTLTALNLAYHYLSLPRCLEKTMVQLHGLPFSWWQYLFLDPFTTAATP